MIRALLRWFGFYKIDYGFSCGRHWMRIDGNMIAQTPGDIWLRDDDVQRLVYEIIDHGEFFSEPRCYCTQGCTNPDYKWCKDRRRLPQVSEPSK